MQTRQPNLEGAGEIPLRRLVKEALRMRPSRIVVGEVRQKECLDLTQYGSTHTALRTFRACNEGPRSQPNPGQSLPLQVQVNQQSVVTVSLTRSLQSTPLGRSPLC